MARPSFLYINGSKDVPSSIIKLGESIMQKTGVREGDAVQISTGNKHAILWVRKSSEQNKARANSELLNLLFKGKKGIVKIAKTTLKESKFVELKPLEKSDTNLLDSKLSLIFTPVVENGYVVVFLGENAHPLSFKVQRVYPSPSFITTATQIFFS